MTEKWPILDLIKEVSSSNEAALVGESSMDFMAEIEGDETLGYPQMQEAIEDQIELIGSSDNLRRMRERAYRDFEGNGPLVDEIYDVFLEELRNSDLGQYLSETELYDFTELCVYGQVPTESAWLNNDDTGDIRGLWQINRRYYPNYDLNNPLESTRAAVFVYNQLFMQRQELILGLQGEASNAEFLFPMLLQGYNRGTGVIRAIMNKYMETHPNWREKRENGLDVFRLMVVEANEVQDGILGRNMNEEGVNYVPRVMGYANLLTEE